MKKGESWGEKWRRYLRLPLDPFWRHPEQHLLIWLAYALLVGVLVFASLRLRYDSVPPQFTGMYAWHTALNFGLCFVAADLALGGFSRWRRRPHTIGEMVLVGFGTYLVGFALQRTLVFEAIAGYYRNLLLWYRKLPSTRPTAVRMFLYCLPYWVLAHSCTLCLMLRLQRPLTSTAASATAPSASTPDSLLLTTDRGVVRLRPETITHVSMDDHYANIHLEEEEGRRKMFIRMTLQQLLSQLPREHFVQIHRSHLVNLHHLVELRKVGRSWETLVGRERHPLPVSRQRVRELREYLHIRQELAQK